MTRGNPPVEQADVVFAWAGNWAAVVGVVICAVLLLAWFEDQARIAREAREEQ